MKLCICGKSLTGQQRKYCSVECQARDRAQKKRERGRSQDATVFTGIKVGNKIIWVRHKFDEEGTLIAKGFELKLTESLNIEDNAGVR